jgi:hypothetical protein
MARGNTWTNADGLEVGFGVRTSHNPEGAEIHTLGLRSEVTLHLSSESYLDVATGTLKGKEMVIPAGSVVRSASVNVTEAITGSTDFIVGLKDNVDGTTIDDDGLITAVESALTVGVVDGATGAVLGTALAADSVVSVDVTGAMTAGEFVITIVFDNQPPSNDAPDVIVGEI